MSGITKRSRLITNFPRIAGITAPHLARNNSFPDVLADTCPLSVEQERGLHWFKLRVREPRRSQVHTSEASSPAVVCEVTARVSTRTDTSGAGDDAPVRLVTVALPPVAASASSVEGESGGRASGSENAPPRQNAPDAASSPTASMPACLAVPKAMPGTPAQRRDRGAWQGGRMCLSPCTSDADSTGLPLGPNNQND